MKAVPYLDFSNTDLVAVWGHLVIICKDRILGSPLYLYWYEQGQGHSFFLWHLDEVQQYYLKDAVLVGCLFPSPLARENVLSLELLLALFLGGGSVCAHCCFHLPDFSNFSLGHLRNKKTQGTQLLRSIDDFHSSPCFKVFLFLWYI